MIRKDGASDGCGVGFYFRNVTELIFLAFRAGSTKMVPW
jgi:hypothetical protein